MVVLVVVIEASFKSVPLSSLNSRYPQRPAIWKCCSPLVNVSRLPLVRTLMRVYGWPQCSVGSAL